LVYLVRQALLALRVPQVKMAHLDHLDPREVQEEVVPLVRLDLLVQQELKDPLVLQRLQSLKYLSGRYPVQLRLVFLHQPHWALWTWVSP
jgi:hypothetical protein